MNGAPCEASFFPATPKLLLQCTCADHVQEGALATATERVPVLMTPAEKKRIARKAEKAGVSVPEYLRRAAAAFSPEQDNDELAALLTQVERSTASASAAIDDALAYVDASNKRIAEMELAARRAR